MRTVIFITVMIFFFPLQVQAFEGTYSDSGQLLGNPGSFNGNDDVQIGDLDGDGDTDAIFISGSGGTENVASYVWLNDGTGVFVAGTGFTIPWSRESKLGDLDGDGDLDIFVTSQFSKNNVWLNDGNGVFSDTGQNIGVQIRPNRWPDSWGVDLGDLDGDGDLDAFVANYQSNDRVWLNDGNGVFYGNGQSLGGNQRSSDVNLDDLDGDGDLDAFVTTEWGSNKVWLNDGGGIFTDSGQVLGSSISHAVDLGDVNGDGYLDAIVANRASQGNRIWLNDGSGNFTAGQSIGRDDSRDVQLGDMDNDGDLDAVMGDYSNTSSPIRIWINDGSGSFTDSGQALGNDDVFGLALDDINADGYLDIFAANWGSGQQNRLYLSSFLSTPTPIPSSTHTPSPTPTHTPSPTPTGTFTPPPTHTPSPTPTGTFTPPPTPTETTTNTPTPISTGIITPTPTPTSGASDPCDDPLASQEAQILCHHFPKTNGKLDQVLALLQSDSLTETQVSTDTVTIAFDTGNHLTVTKSTWLGWQLAGSFVIVILNIPFVYSVFASTTGYQR